MGNYLVSTKGLMMVRLTASRMDQRMDESMVAPRVEQKDQLMAWSTVGSRVHSTVCCWDSPMELKLAMSMVHSWGLRMAWHLVGCLVERKVGVLAGH